MEKIRKAELIEKLTEKLQVAKAQAKQQNQKDSYPQLFVGGGEERINQRYISNEQYFQVAQLYNYLMENENLTHEEFQEILKSKFVKFAFLRKLNRVVKNLDEELRTHGIRYVATKYAEKKYVNDAFNHWLHH